MKYKIINKEHLKNMVCNINMKEKEGKKIDTKEVIRNLEMYLDVDLTNLKNYLMIE